MDRKTEIPGLYKTSEGFLINKDSKGLAMYKANREKAKELVNLKDDIKTLKDDMKEIKELLKGLVK
jgi:predicted phage-related endonuclease